MVTSRRIYDLFRRLYLPALVGVLAVSCVDDSSLCLEDQPGYNSADNIWISMEVKNQGISGYDNSYTRADILNDAQEHPEERASVDENYIDLNDITLVLLDENDRTMKVLTAGDFILKSVENTDYTEYELVASVNRAYFEFAGKSMSLLAVANVNGIRPDLTHDNYDVVPFQASLTDLSSQLRKFTYDGYKSSGQLIPWQPDKDNGTHIPMAGFKKGIAVPSAEKLDNANTIETAINLGAVTMQRSMAKIRVLDGVRLQTMLPFHHAEINSVTLCSGTNTGAYVPPTAQLTSWSNGTSIFERAPRPNPVTLWSDASLKIPTYNGGSFTVKSTDDSKRTYDTSFICYTTEIAVWSLRNTDVRPYFEIATTSYNEDNSVAEKKTHTVYLDECLSNTTDVARNHIYEFIVTMSEKAVLNIDYTVCEWKTATSGNITFN